jgi:cytidylate kinase
MIVAIDGPAGSGKSTVARALARRLGFTYLDSGALYRTVTLLALEAGADLEDEESLGLIAQDATIELFERDHDYVQVIANGRDVSEEIRAPRVTGASSKVAAQPRVRAALLSKQRELIAAGDYVVEGRDIGTVVAPDAAVKLFLTADATERASRRAGELQRRGHEAQAGEVRAAIEQRDRLDSTRSAAPLRTATDAVTIDTTGLAVEDVVERALQLVERARA